MTALLSPSAVNDRPVIAAIGGGHGLAATLTALRQLPVFPVGVVGTADDGASSGRLRKVFPCLPPGDLRMALTALLPDTERGTQWRELLGYRFDGASPLGGHAIGNLMLLAFLLRDESVGALVAASEFLAIDGVVVPACGDALDLVATIAGPDNMTSLLRGQGTIATSGATVESIYFEPESADADERVAQVVREANAIIMGPGSWWTSVIPPLLLPHLHEAIVASSGLRILVLNLGAQPGETAGYTPESHLHVLSDVLPDLVVDVVIADDRVVSHPAELAQAASELGAEVVYGHIAQSDATGNVTLAHDSAALANVLARVLDTHGRINACP